MPAPFHISVLHGLCPLFLFATFNKSLMINTSDIDDILTTGAPIHTINEHLAPAGGHHTLTYNALTCKHQRASQAGSSICVVTALNCVRLAFQLEVGEGVELEESILRSYFSEEMMNVNTLFNFICRGNLMILILASNGHNKRFIF